MKLLFYFGHPAQYFFLRETIKRLKKANHDVILLIKTKDVLEDILIKDQLDYINILPAERGLSKLSILFSLVKRLVKIFSIIIKNRPNLLIGTDASIAILGKLMRINRISITEDDYNVIKTLADITYPFTQTILCPSVCDVGNHKKKKIGYQGYMKLGYLHPNVFTPHASVKFKYNLGEKYILIRLARLTAHHDFGIKGISEAILRKLISSAEKSGFKVYISSESNLVEEFNKYRLNINPSDMHSVLANASMLICDSQSMSVEAAMLGVPSIRVSDFVGKISVLEELEHNYDLTFGIKPSDEVSLYKKINELLDTPDVKEVFQERRSRMLNDKIDVTAFLTWFLQNYPASKKLIKENPDYQYNFK
jgi:predicted glycosyltransferase